MFTDSLFVHRTNLLFSSVLQQALLTEVPPRAEMSAQPCPLPLTLPILLGLKPLCYKFNGRSALGVMIM